MPADTIIDTRVAGIPCRARITHYHRQEPRGSWASNDYDCYGYTVCEFEVLDRRGRPAAWLERKVTDADRSRIASEYAEHLADLRDEADEYEWSH